MNRRKSSSMESIMSKMLIGLFAVVIIVVCAGLFIDKAKYPQDITETSVSGTWYSQATDTYYSWQDGNFYYQDPEMRENQELVQWDYDIMLHDNGKMMLTYYNAKDGALINSFEMRYNTETQTLSFLDEEGLLVDSMTPYVEENQTS